jgi:hypothetical protein
MNLNELGLQLRTLYPHLISRRGTHAQLAQFFLANYPEYQDLISPVYRKLHHVATEDFESQRLTERGRLESDHNFELTRTLKLQNIHLADMMFEATSLRVPVTALEPMAVKSHDTEQQIILERAKRDIGLEGAERVSLKAHQLISTLEAELAELITKRDKEPHKEKKADLTESIEFKREELRGRRKQALVSVGVRSPLGDDEGPDGDGSGGTSNERDVERVAGPDARMGF